MTKQRTCKERPIIFSAPMVRAILDGRKTVMRRIVKWPGWANSEDAGQQAALVRDRVLALYRDCRPIKVLRCPYGAPGDRLWVRETWGMTYTDLVPTGRPFTVGGTWGSPSRPGRPPCVVFKADGDMPDDSPHETARWSPSIHMPRWASRITLEITGIRVERLHEINFEDAKAEGVERRVVCDGWREYGLPPDIEAAGTHPLRSARDSFESLWASIHGPGSWDENPWVWVIKFRRVP